MFWWLRRRVESYLRRSDPLRNGVRRLAERLSPGDTLLLHYPIQPKRRWTETARHEEL